jgi:hypothetical protein
MYDSAVSIEVSGDNSVMLMGSAYSFMADFFNTKVTVDEQNGIFNEHSEELTFFPNPTQNVIQFFADNNEEILVEIYDMTGRLVISQILFPGTTRLEVTTLATGKYEVRFQGKNGTSVSSLIIQR